MSEHLKAPTRRPDRIGRIVMLVLGLTTLIPLVLGLLALQTTDQDVLITEAWRSLGYTVFAGLWLLLAAWPRSLPGLWELLLFHKAAITLYALLNIDAPTASETVVIDGVLTIGTLIAFVLCRGWLAWRNVAPSPAR